MMEILDSNACRNCRRPISLIKDVGWLHRELPQYAHEDLTCGRAWPVDPRCPVCDILVPASNVTGGRKLSWHGVPGHKLCSGSGAIVPCPS
jgi:hypothetical protein